MIKLFLLQYKKKINILFIMELNIDFLLKNKHMIELLLLNNSKIYDDCLKQHSVFDNKILMVEYNDINDILCDENYEPGIYGFLNYQLDLKYDKMLIKNYEFNNKPGIVKKILDSTKMNFLEDAIAQNYGLIEMYEKQEDGIIVELKKYHLLKNTEINSINDTNYDKIVIKMIPNDFIVTQIYKFDSKITLLSIMTKNEYVIESNDNELFIKYDKLVKQLCIDNKKMINYMTNFDNIYKLNRINNGINESNYLNLNDVLEFDFSDIINNFKSNKSSNVKEYTELIEKYYGLTLDDLFEEILNKYSIIDKTRPAIKLILEIVLRLYIDIKLGCTHYNLTKNLLQYIPKQKNSDLYSNIKSQTLIDRHWRNLLGYDEITIELDTFNIKPMVLSIFQMLKIHNLDYILSYLEQIFDKNENLMKI